MYKAQNPKISNFRKTALTSGIIASSEVSWGVQMFYANIIELNIKKKWKYFQSSINELFL